MVLVDTHILIDILAADPQWADRSLRLLDDVSADDDIAINPVIYAELAAGFRARAALDRFLAAHDVAVLDMSRAGAFRAGQAFMDYRRRGGPKPRVMADFLIGGHADADGLRLATRDGDIYRRCFPTVELLTP